MKITFKTLTRDQFEIDCEPQETIADVKGKVASFKKYGDSDGVRIIHKGKVLKDPMTLGGAGVTEASFLVVMPPKPKQAATKKAAPEKKEEDTTKSDTSSAADAKKADEKKDDNTTAATATPSTPASGSSDQATPAGASSSGGFPGALLTGAEYDAAVTRISEMGFSQDKVKAAMKAAFHNPDRAVEYLFTGIPESPQEETLPAAQSGAQEPSGNAASTGDSNNASGQSTNETSDTNGPGTTPFNMFAPPPQNQGGNRGGGGGGGGGDGGMDFLRNRGSMDAMRRAVQSNPELINQILGQIAQNDPEMLSRLSMNPEEVASALGEGMPRGTQGGSGDVANLAEGMRSGAVPPGSHVISVNHEEQQQLERLSELGQSFGLSRNSVLQAWLACDRNENLAANYMADNMEDLRETEADAEGDEAAPQGGANQSSGSDQGQGKDSQPPQS